MHQKSRNSRLSGTFYLYAFQLLTLSFPPYRVCRTVVEFFTQLKGLSMCRISTVIISRKSAGFGSVWKKIAKCEAKSHLFCYFWWDIGHLGSVPSSCLWGSVGYNQCRFYQISSKWPCRSNKFLDIYRCRCSLHPCFLLFHNCSPFCCENLMKIHFSLPWSSNHHWTFPSG